MADESTLKKHLEDFQKAVKKLGNSVNKNRDEWNDAQYSNLSDSIKGVAALSKQVLIFGNKCSSAIKRFNVIESER